MLPLLIAAVAMQAYGRGKANMDQAGAEEANASFYRDQAAYARDAGDRQQKIFGHESKILYGEETSAFAKAGVDTQNDSLFMAKTMLARDQESNAIKLEADFNVRLAMLRADQSHATAERLSSPTNNAMQMFGMGASAFAGSS